MRIQIRKDGMDVAGANRFHKLTVCADLDIPGLRQLDLVYFPTVVLTPPVTFEHLAGTGLNQFFDRCQIASTMGDGVPTGCLSAPFRYVHGKSEVMKGKHSVSAVLLARPEFEGEISEPQWLSYLPRIWRHFLTVYDSCAVSS